MVAMPIFFLLTIVVSAFVVALLFRRGGSKSARVTEPSCGNCRYCVRGLETFTCPECGSDLREVGILTPGATKPMGAGAKLLLWTGLSIAPALVFAMVVSQHITPYSVNSTRTRTIFVRTPATTGTVVVKQAATVRTFGRPVLNAAIPPQTMTLTWGNRAQGEMAVNLASGDAQFTNLSGAKVKGTFDVPFIAQWMNALGLTDPAISGHAPHVLAAIDEMKDGGGGNFSQYAPNQNRGMQPDVNAHPATPAFNVPRPTALGQAMPFLLMGCFWLLGLPFVLRRSRVQSRGDAHQA